MGISSRKPIASILSWAKPYDVYVFIYIYIYKYKHIHIYIYIYIIHIYIIYIYIYIYAGAVAPRDFRKAAQGDVKLLARETP